MSKTLASMSGVVAEIDSPLSRYYFFGSVEADHFDKEVDKLEHKIIYAKVMQFVSKRIGQLTETGDCIDMWELIKKGDVTFDMVRHASHVHGYNDDLSNFFQTITDKFDALTFVLSKDEVKELLAYRIDNNMFRDIKKRLAESNADDKDIKIAAYNKIEDLFQYQTIYVLMPQFFMISKTIGENLGIVPKEMKSSIPIPVPTPFAARIEEAAVEMHEGSVAMLPKADVDEEDKGPVLHDAQDRKYKDGDDTEPDEDKVPVIKRQRTKETEEVSV